MHAQIPISCATHTVRLRIIREKSKSRVCRTSPSSKSDDIRAVPARVGNYNKLTSKLTLLCHAGCRQTNRSVSGRVAFGRVTRVNIFTLAGDSGVVSARHVAAQQHSSSAAHNNATAVNASLTKRFVRSHDVAPTTHPAPLPLPDSNTMPAQLRRCQLECSLPAA
jgi:hypothetical protein